MLRAAEVLAERSTRMFVKPMNIALLFGWGRDLDRAFEWLDRSYDLKDHDLAYLAALPADDHFMDDPRFAAMLRPMKLPATAAAATQ